MKKNKLFYKYPVIQISLLLLTFFSIGLVFYLLYCNRISNTYVSYIQDSAQSADIHDISIEFSIPRDKFWQQGDGSYGAQVDGKFTNNTNHVFTDWTVTIKVPENYWVDSNWNADFSFYYSNKKPIPSDHSDYAEYLRQYKTDENLIEMTKIPNNQDTAIEGKNKKKSESFAIGMILYTPTPFQVHYAEIKGRFIYSPGDSPLYYILITGIILTTLVLAVLIIIQLVVSSQVKHYELRQKLDSDIIVQSFKTFANFVDAKDPYTKGHSLRVAHYAREIAKRLKMTEHEQMEMFWLGLMHDVGKISVSDDILNKPSRLDGDEFTQIQAHVQKGYEMLMDFTAMPKLKEVAKSHHEHWDGTGYCEGLKGQEIPLEARIVCICDSFDAMNSNRCYRPHLTKEETIKELERCSGTHFDPKLVKIMIQMILDKSIEKIENVDTLNTINYRARK